jgi:hypothetical protein
MSGRSLIEQMKTAGWIAVAMAALAASGCGENPTPTIPSTPVQVTEAFSGTVTPNGANTQVFSTQGAGGVTAVLTALTPEVDPPTAVSMALGTWNTTTSTCTLIVTNDAATKGAIVSGTATGATPLCLRVSDPKGTLTETVTYGIDLTHF